MTMRTDNWIERGLVTLQARQWFDGTQLLRGALQRAVRLNQPEKVKLILRKSSEFLLPEQQNDLYCHFILETLPLLGKKNREKDWVVILPEILSILREGKLDTCITKFLNKLVSSKKFQDLTIIDELYLQVTEMNFTLETKSDLFYCLAGLRLSRKEYLKCFEILSEWDELVPSSARLLAYLTLAELNAFEIDGCGKFLDRAKSEVEVTRYIEIVSQLFKASELTDYDLFKSIIEDNTDLVSSQNDILLKLLCDGIANFLKPKDSKGMLSLFGG